MTQQFLAMVIGLLSDFNNGLWLQWARWINSATVNPDAELTQTYNLPHTLKTWYCAFVSVRNNTHFSTGYMIPNKSSITVMAYNTNNVAEVMYSMTWFIVGY